MEESIHWCPSSYVNKIKISQIELYAAYCYRITTSMTSKKKAKKLSYTKPDDPIITDESLFIVDREEELNKQLTCKSQIEQFQARCSNCVSKQKCVYRTDYPQNKKKAEHTVSWGERNSKSWWAKTASKTYFFIDRLILV